MESPDDPEVIGIPEVEGGRYAFETVVDTLTLSVLIFKPFSDSYEYYCGSLGCSGVGSSFLGSRTALFGP